MNTVTAHKPFDEAIQFRNDFWTHNASIPHWVNIETEGLDRFFTKPEIAKLCYTSFIDILAKNNVNLNNYKFIEPSCG
ncbi:MAG: hypothetical protein ACR2PY_02575, partial [Salinispira sp.]